jgi:hypothetical protein
MALTRARKSHNRLLSDGAALLETGAPVGTPRTGEAVFAVCDARDAVVAVLHMTAAEASEVLEYIGLVLRDRQGKGYTLNCYTARAHYLVVEPSHVQEQRA